MSNENYDKEYYDEEDVKEMVRLVEEVKTSSDATSSNKHSRRISLREDDMETISVYELKAPSEQPDRDITDDSIYTLLRNMLMEMMFIDKECKYQSRKINKIHHDFIHLNNTLVNIDNSLHIQNLIKLYEKGIIFENELVDEIEEIMNIKFYEDDEDETQ